MTKRMLVDFIGATWILIVLAPFGVSATADDGEQTLQWISQVNDTALNFHCRIKFGDDPTKFGFSSDLIEEKWDTIEADLSRVSANGATGKWKEIDKRLVHMFRLQGAYEKFLQAKERELQQKFNYFFIRQIAEELGGDVIREMYAAMPNDWAGKEDMQSLVDGWMTAGVEISDLRDAVTAQDKEAYDYIRDSAGGAAQKIISELNRTRYPAAVSEFELSWLKKNRPGLLDRMTIQSGGALRDLRERWEPILKPRMLEDMKQYGGDQSRRFLLRREWAEQYEKQQLPWLAVRQYEAASKLFWFSYQETMLNKAAQFDPEENWFETLQALQQSTLHPVRKGGFNAKELIAISPISSTVLPKQIEAAGGRLGYLGGIELAAPPIDLQIIDAGQRVVLLCQNGLLTYDLRTGEREHLMFDQKSGVQLSEMAVTGDGQYAYVVSSEPAIQRFDLTRGVRDSTFTSPLVKRRDTHVAVSPDGKWLATALLGKVKLFQVNNTSQEKLLKGLRNSIMYGLKFSADGRLLAAHGNDRRIKWIDLRSNQSSELSIVDEKTSYVYALYNQPSGRIIACGRGVLRIWEKMGGKPTFHVKLPLESSGKFYWADVTPDRQYVVSSHGIWNYQSGELVVRYSPNWTAQAMAMTPDGQRLVLATGRSLFVTPLALTHPDALRRGLATARPGGPSAEPPSTAADLPTVGVGDVTNPVEPFRLWVDKTGKYKIEAQFVRRDGAKVVLKKKSGETISISIDVLSAVDQKYVNDQ